MALPAAAPAPSPAPVNIAYESEHCRVRELDLDDACEAIGNWMADPAIARALNAPARSLSLEDVRKYIAGHDRVSGHLLGVFRKLDGELIGLWSVYIDWQHSEFLVNVLIPGSIPGEMGALKETGRPLYDIMFDELGLDTMRYNILASNKRMLDRNVPGSPKMVDPEHVSTVASASGEGQEQIQHYRVTRAERDRIRTLRAERDAAWLAARKARKEAED